MPDTVRRRLLSVALTGALAIGGTGCTVTVGSGYSRHDQAAAVLLGDHAYEIDTAKQPSRAELQLESDESIVVYGTPDDQPFTLTLAAGNAVLIRPAQYLVVLCLPGGQSFEVRGLNRSAAEQQADLLGTEPLGIPRRKLDAAVAEMRAYEREPGLEDLVRWVSGPVRADGATVAVQVRVSRELTQHGLSYAVRWPQDCA